MALTLSSAPLLTLTLRSISLRRTRPTLEFLTAVARLFPDLRELSIELWEFVSITICCTGRNAPLPPPIPDDSRSTALLDAEAFDHPAAEEISDSESDSRESTSEDIDTESESEDSSPPSPAPESIESQTPFPSTLHDDDEGFMPSVQCILNPLFTGRVLLPSSLEVFRIHADEEMFPPALSAQQQRHTIAKLTLLCPLLREVQFGSISDNWKREGDVWKAFHPSGLSLSIEYLGAARTASLIFELTVYRPPQPNPSSELP
ncbi:hypothetical protein C8F04DRAFT_1200314 [Mycena alexandri]|uniref:Uncharacterized protein n=1 Tax=Mycena alexandri TaxID=1745969 RepID=A0AAD6WM33_9AGAR|nr:hypothetical protein C8F04DRAFT_1200314 [Mycena alexandri]